MNGTWPISMTSLPDRTARRARLPLAIMVLLALATGFVAAQTLTQIDFAVKLAVAAMFAIVAIALVTFRPIVFPLSLYLFLVPFDGVLQTGSGTLTKFLAAASMAVIILLVTDRRRTIAPPLVVGLWALYLSWNVASLMWSEDPWYRIDLLDTNIMVFALFAVFSVVRITWGELKVLMLATVAGAVACAG